MTDAELEHIMMDQINADTDWHSIATGRRTSAETVVEVSMEGNPQVDTQPVDSPMGSSSILDVDYLQAENAELRAMVTAAGGLLQEAYAKIQDLEARLAEQTPPSG